MRKPTTLMALMLLVMALGFMSQQSAQAQEAVTYDEEFLNHDPQRKMGRGWANILFSWLEFPIGVNEIRESHGDIAAVTWGVIVGWDRMRQRQRQGWYEIHTADTREKLIIEPEFRMRPDYDPSWRYRYLEESF